MVLFHNQGNGDDITCLIVLKKLPKEQIVADLNYYILQNGHKASLSPIFIFVLNINNKNIFFDNYQTVSPTYYINRSLKVCTLSSDKYDSINAFIKFKF